MDVSNGIATLGLTIKQDGVEQATQGLDRLAVSADKVEASTKRYIGTNDGLTASQRAVLAMTNEQRRLYEQFTGTTLQLGAAQAEVANTYTESRRIVLQHAQAMELTGSIYRDNRAIVLQHIEALEMEAAAHETAGRAAGVHGLNLGRLNMELGTATGRILGMNTAATRFGAMLGGSLGGYTQMIAITAGLIALVEIYDHLTGKSKELEKAQEELTKSAEKWYDTERRGADGERARQLDAEIQKVTDLAEAYRKMQEAAAGPAHAAPAGAGLGVSYGAIGSEQTRKDLEKGNETVVALERDLTNKLSAEQVRRLASIVESHHATKAEMERLEADLATIRDRIAHNLNIAGQSSTLGERADLLALLQQGERALKPEIASATGDKAYDPDGIIPKLQKQLVEMRKVNEEENIANVQREYEIKLVGMIGYAKDVLLAQEKAELDTLKAYHDYVGTALNDRLATIQNDEDAAIAKAKLVRTLQEEIDKRTTLNDITKQVDAIGKRNEEQGKKELDYAAKQIKDAQAYHDQIEKIARTSIERIISHGMKSWQDFFGDVLKGFEAMMAAMEAEAKKHNTTPGGAGYTALQYGTIAISSGLAGYDIAKQTGNRAESVIGGAASGAELGGSIAGPPGAFLGAMAGTIGALVGLHKSASEVADALRKMQLGQDQVALSLAQWRAQITGTAADQKAAAQLALKVQYEQLVQTIETTEAGKKQEEQRNKDLSEAAKLYADAQKKLTDSTNALTDSMLNAVQGYKYQAAIFEAAGVHAAPGAPMQSAPPTPPPSSGGGAGYSGGGQTTDGALTVKVVLGDGSVLGTAVLKDFKRRAQGKFGSTTKWNQIQ